MLDNLCTTWTPRLLSILRIMTALLFLQHPLAKFLGFPIVMTNPLNTLTTVAGVIELVCSVPLLLGLFTRPAAFILSGEMAVAYWMLRPARGMYPLGNGGEIEVLFCFVFLFLAFAGGGPWSLDAVLRKKA
jgi:putative oxidoreductase